ncbi:MAG: hypothetical protein ABI706_14480 [Ilumatobacteraceae bacterium]
MRQRIGIVLQECGVDTYLTVTEVPTVVGLGVSLRRFRWEPRIKEQAHG